MMAEITTPELGSGDSAEIDIGGEGNSYVTASLYSDGSLYAYARDDDANSWEYPASGSLAAGTNRIGMYVSSHSSVQLLANGAVVDGTSSLVNFNPVMVWADVGINRSDPSVEGSVDDRMGIAKVAIYTNLTLEQALALTT